MARSAAAASKFARRGCGGCTACGRVALHRVCPVVPATCPTALRWPCSRALLRPPVRAFRRPPVRPATARSGTRALCASDGVVDVASSPGPRKLPCAQGGLPLFQRRILSQDAPLLPRFVPLLLFLRSSVKVYNFSLQNLWTLPFSLYELKDTAASNNLELRRKQLRGAALAARLRRALYRAHRKLRAYAFDDRNHAGDLCYDVACKLEVAPEKGLAHHRVGL